MPETINGRKWRERIRKSATLKGLPRSASRSLFHSGIEAITPEPRNPVMLWTKAIWAWVKNYVKVMFKRRTKFRTYPVSGSKRPGIYQMPDKCAIGLAADWGSGTISAYKVRDAMLSKEPDITIHLGDVYFSGTDKEFQDYFLGSEDWPKGKLQPGNGSSAHETYILNGNHEMYSGGRGYFELALPQLKQEASYFCLENSNWRIVAIDTGYYAKTFPILELFSSFIRLHKENLSWLSDIVFADANDKRPVILLSHHNWFSAYDSEYKRMGRQLVPYLDRVLLWLWGHEHKFIGYAPFGFEGKTVRTRCIGHGGMPVELGFVPKRERGLIFTDERKLYELEGKEIGYCGFAFLGLDGPQLRLEYCDEERNTLLVEQWEITPAGLKGTVSGGDELKVYRSLEELVR